jgi:Protein of unknown function (DUF2939)
MRAKWPLIGLLVALAGSYAAWPYVTLYRLGHAIRDGNAKALTKLVDWPAVREGIKEDICDFVLEEPAGGRPVNALPAFGASFVRGVTATSIDRSLTPQALVGLATASPSQPEGAAVRVGWAFFNSLTGFSVDLLPEGQPEPIRLDLALRHGQWRVNRVWLPVKLLEQAGART